MSGRLLARILNIEWNYQRKKKNFHSIAMTLLGFSTREFQPFGFLPCFLPYILSDITSTSHILQVKGMYLQERWLRCSFLECFCAKKNPLIFNVAFYYKTPVCQTLTCFHKSAYENTA
jgi:hypothetical protein